MKRFWTASEVRQLRRLYPNMLTDKVAKKLRMTLPRVYNKAHALGLHKSPAFMASDASGRLTKLSAAGVRYRFRKGITPWNLGKRGYMGANRTSFRSGQMPHNTCPVGSYRITKDGTLQRKTSNAKGNNSARWRGVHELVWIAAHGPVPKKHIVVFKPGMRTTNADEITLDRVECISLVENMRRNTYHRYPKEIALAIQLRGALQRKINARGRNEQHL